jgi:hypothetical protein
MPSLHFGSSRAASTEQPARASGGAALPSTPGGMSSRSARSGTAASGAKAKRRRRGDTEALAEALAEEEDAEDLQAKCADISTPLMQKLLERLRAAGTGTDAGVAGVAEVAGVAGVAGALAQPSIDVGAAAAAEAEGSPERDDCLHMHGPPTESELSDDIRGGAGDAGPAAQQRSSTQRAAFRDAYMGLLADDAAAELDALRREEPPMDEAALKQLIDALEFGCDTFVGQHQWPLFRASFAANGWWDTRGGATSSRPSRGAGVRDEWGGDSSSGSDDDEEEEDGGEQGGHAAAVGDGADVGSRMATSLMRRMKQIRDQRRGKLGKRET